MTLRRAEKDFSLVALVAGATSIKITILTTSERKVELALSDLRYVNISTKEGSQKLFSKREFNRKSNCSNCVDIPVQRADIFGSRIAAKANFQDLLE